MAVVDNWGIMGEMDTVNGARLPHVVCDADADCSVSSVCFVVVFVVIALSVMAVVNRHVDCVTGVIVRCSLINLKHGFRFAPCGVNVLDVLFRLSSVQPLDLLLSFGSSALVFVMLTPIDAIFLVVSVALFFLVFGSVFADCCVGISE